MRMPRLGLFILCITTYRYDNRHFHSSIVWIPFLLAILTNAKQPDALSKALLDDIIPPSSTLCAAGSEGTTISFTFSPDPQNQWDATAAPYEQNLFLFQMGHDEPNTNRTWKIKVGRGSNMYSFIGAYGESVPPQYHSQGEFVDEVWQNVVVSSDGSTNHSSDALWFVHQAGSYANDERTSPFFSPNVGNYCEVSHCSTASWGQQAQWPTQVKSSALYLNRYMDCGNGVVEVTSVIHNMRSDHQVDETFTYMDVPWGGVRTSTLADMLIANVETGGQPVDLGMFGDDTWLPNLNETGGYTAFAQHLPKDKETFNMPDGLSLKSLGKCSESAGHSESLGIYTVSCPIEPTIIIKTGWRAEMTLTNPSTGGSVPINGIYHWSWNGNTLFFFPLVPAEEINNVFPAGASMVVSYRDGGIALEDNLALSVVHGTHAKASWDRANSRLRFGYGGLNPLRDYTVFTVNTLADISPGQTYIQRHFMITDQLLQIDSRSRTWSSETLRKLLNVQETAQRSREVRLYISSQDSTMFSVQIAPDQCSQAPACVGYTAPSPDTVAYFAISCGDVYYVGADLYHFSPVSQNSVQPWNCADVGAEPSWKILGYFQVGSCPLALTTAKFGGYDCPVLTTQTSVPISSSSASSLPGKVLSVSPFLGPSPVSTGFFRPTTIPKKLPVVVPVAESDCASCTSGVPPDSSCLMFTLLISFVPWKMNSLLLL